MSVNRLVIKTEDNVSIDSEQQYNTVVLGCTGYNNKEVSNFVSQEWFDESGEDVYVPSNIRFKAYEVTFKLGTKPSSSKTYRQNKDEFVAKLYGKNLNVSQEYIGVTLKGCYVTKVVDEDVTEEYVVFSITFKVTDP